MNNLFNHIYENKKVLITGHTGFKGSWLTYWLKQLGAKITGFSKDIPTDPSLFEVLMLEKEIDHIIGDVRDHDTLLEVIHDVKPDFIFHLAAQPLVRESFRNPTETMTTNIIGVNNILDALRTYDRNCIAIIITSDKSYDNLEFERGYKENDLLGGKDPYSASKGAAELVVKGYYHSFFKTQDLIRVATVRAGNVIGGGDWAKDRIIPDCIRSWEQGGKVEIRNPNSTRPWQHVLEPLSGYLTLACKLFQSPTFNGWAFNFGPQLQNNHTVLRLIQELAKNYCPNDDLPYEINDDILFHEAVLLKLDCKKAEKYLNWYPSLNFEQTAYFTSKWYSSYESADVHDLTRDQIENYCNIASNKGLLWTK